MKINKATKQKIFFGISLCIALCFAVLVVIIVRHLYNQTTNIDVATEQVSGVKSFILPEKPFDELNLQAGSALVYDPITQKILFQKDINTERPIASITKVVSALVSSNILDSNNQIQIDSNALAQFDDNGLLLNEKWSFKDLLDFSLMVSSNDGAYAIASIAGAFGQTIKAPVLDPTATTTPIVPIDPDEQHVNQFVNLMNQKVASLGLTNTYFNNPSGLDVSLTEAGGYSTALEVAKLFSHIIHHDPSVLEATRLPEKEFLSESGLLHPIKNTNASYSDIPALIASKTGFTDLAGGNLAVAYDVGINHPVIIVVLASGYKERFTDMNKLVEATNLYFAK